MMALETGRRAAGSWIFMLVAAGVASAENVDPRNDGSQYAYSENRAWINAIVY